MCTRFFYHASPTRSWQGRFRGQPSTGSIGSNRPLVSGRPSLPTGPQQPQNVYRICNKKMNARVILCVHMCTSVEYSRCGGAARAPSSAERMLKTLNINRTDVITISGEKHRKDERRREERRKWRWVEEGVQLKRKMGFKRGKVKIKYNKYRMKDRSEQWGEIVSQGLRKHLSCPGKCDYMVMHCKLSYEEGEEWNKKDRWWKMEELGEGERRLA